MRKYLKIGVAVQIFIILLRAMLGKSKEDFKENKTNVFFLIAVLCGSIVNIILWPLSIVSEIILTKEGI